MCCLNVDSYHHGYFVECSLLDVVCSLLYVLYIIDLTDGSGQIFPGKIKRSQYVTMVFVYSPTERQLHSQRIIQINKFNANSCIMAIICDHLFCWIFIHSISCNFRESIPRKENQHHGVTHLVQKPNQRQKERESPPSRCGYISDPGLTSPNGSGTTESGWTFQCGRRCVLATWWRLG